MRTTITRKLIWLLATLFISQGVLAQDIHFSQFSDAPMNINPALTGIFGGEKRFVANYRSQWNTVPVSYLTFSGAYDMKFDGDKLSKGFWSGGVVFNYDMAGDSKLNNAKLGLSGSYSQRLDTRNALTLGMYFGGNQRAFKTDDLHFDREFDGKKWNPDLDNGESFDDQSVFFTDFSAGVNFHHQVLKKRTQFDVGMGLFHVNQPQKNFYEEEDQFLERRWSIYGLGTIMVSDGFDILLRAMGQFQKPHQEVVVGAGGRFFINQRPTQEFSIELGLNYRLDDAIIPVVAFYHQAWKVGLSYDINLSDFNRATDYRGGPEVSVAYTIRPVPDVEYCPLCPLYVLR